MLADTASTIVGRRYRLVKELGHGGMGAVFQALDSLTGQEVALKMSTAIKEENGAWNATETVESPMGTSSDVTTIEKRTLIVRKRSAHQGPSALDFDFAGDKVTGKVNMGGQERPISADLGGPLFGDGAGQFLVIGCLPLADGYTTTYRNFDLQKAKAKLMQLKVAGTEKVTTPAGEFDAFKVEISSADGGNDKMTLWIAKETRVPVKISAVIAAMGGATMNSELMP